MQDELAALLSQNLSLEDSISKRNNTGPCSQPTPLTYSASQHYHHSSHLTKSSFTETSPTREDQSDVSRIEYILKSNDIDPQNLFPTQLELFKSVNTDQQLRLIRLWQFFPPNYGNHSLAQDLQVWPQTSLEQEEAMARLRFERFMLQETKKWGFSETDTSKEAHFNLSRISSESINPIKLPDESRMSAEPYIISGYSDLDSKSTPLMDHQNTSNQGVGERQEDNCNEGMSLSMDSHYSLSTDPVYQGSDSSWRTTDDHRTMENQYGAYQQWQHSGFLAPCLNAVGSQDEEML